MGTSLVLYALGVDKDTIFQDYLMTNEFTKASVQAELAAVKEPELVPSLEEGFGVTRQKRERLSEMYLEG